MALDGSAEDATEAVRVTCSPTTGVGSDDATDTSVPVTVSAAAAVVAVPDPLVNVARNCRPESASPAVPVNVVAVAPTTSVQVAPLSDDCCHWTSGVGVP